MIPPENRQRILALDAAGFLAAPGESAEAFFARVEAVEHAEKNLRDTLDGSGTATVFGNIRLAKEDAIPPEIIEEAGDVTEELYGFRARHVPGFFLSRDVGLLWGGCMIADTEEPLALFLIRGVFRKKIRWLFYNRRELQAHELCHSMRQVLGDAELEEFFAYRTSPSALRRYLGNCFIRDYDAVLFVIPTLLLLAAQLVQTFFLPRLAACPFWMIALAYPCWLLFRNQRSRNRYFRAERMLKKWGIGNPRAVLFRCTAPEICEIGKMRSAAEFHTLASRDLRWSVIAERFLQKTSAPECEQKDAEKDQRESGGFSAEIPVVKEQTADQKCDNTVAPADKRKD